MVLAYSHLCSALGDFLPPGAALVVSHDRFFLREFATRVLEITDAGELKDYDSWDAYQACRFHQNRLGGGFKHFLFSPLLGEMIQFE